MRVLITGAGGQLGRDLQRALAGDEVEATDLPDLDVTNAAAVLEAIRSHRPEVVIHAAALTDTARCESEPELAYAVNALGARHVAGACGRVGAAMLYVSTNEVFDGAGGRPYLEFDEPRPINAYGRSKLAGEREVAAILPAHYIVRTAWLYGVGGNHFPARILRAAEEACPEPAEGACPEPAEGACPEPAEGACPEPAKGACPEPAEGGPELSVVTDEVATPTWTADLAEAIARLIRQPVYGVYHLTNGGACSRFEWAREVLRLAGRAEVTVRPVTTAEWRHSGGTGPRKPPYTVLRNLAAARLGIELRPWPEALTDYFQAASRSGA